MSATKTERNAEIAHLYVNEERTIIDLAEQYGIHHERVRQLLLAQGITDRHYGMRARAGRFNKTVEAHTRIAEGLSTLAQEAENLGLKPDTLRQRFNRAGLPHVQHIAQHGSRHYYQHYHCRCDECRTANRDYMRSLRIKGPRIHGTYSAYANYGCRCLECRRAAVVKRQERKQKRIEEAEV